MGKGKGQKVMDFDLATAMTKKECARPPARAPPRAPAERFGAEVRVACSDRGNFGAGGPKAHSQRVKIRVRPANDAPTLSAPELAGAKALYLDEGGRGQLRGVDALDAVAAYRRTWPKADLASDATDLGLGSDGEAAWGRRALEAKLLGKEA